MTQFRSKKDGSHYPIRGGKPSYPSNHDNDIDSRIWNAVPEDYRSIKDGKKYVLARDKKGTVLVPLDSKEARETWGKYSRQRIDGKKGKIVKLIQEGKGQAVRIRFDDGTMADVGIGLLAAREGFSDLSSSEMAKETSKPFHGRKVGDSVRVSTEEPLWG